MDITRESWNRLQDQITKLQADMYYRDGETITTTKLIPITGYLTSSTRLMRFAYHTGKSLKYITTATVSNMTGTIRGISGYVNNASTPIDWVSETDITVSAIGGDEHTILIAVTSTPAYTNVINNIPVVYAPTNLVISLGGV